MSQMPDITYGPATRVRNTEFCTGSDGAEHKRRVQPDGTRTPWEAVTQPEERGAPKEEEAPPPVCLHLVLHNQAEGEPKHWALFAAREGEPGAVFQVTGDATAMHYDFSEGGGANPLAEDSYATSYTLCQLEENGDLARVKACALSEAPPAAENRAAVTENCQGWTVRVLARLREAGVVDAKWVAFAGSMQEPV